MDIERTLRHLLFAAFLAAALTSWGSARAAGVYVQLPPDTDNVDTDGDGDATNDNVSIHLGAGDGFINMADGELMYMFGFGDLNGHTGNDAIMAGMLAAEFPGPTISVREGQRLYLTLTNVGMVMRPDLFDPHTVHWHGYANASSIFDGVPSASIAINMMASLTYFYHVNAPGTYMYHCHVEATEHMQMGMLANLFVEPKQNMVAPGTDLNGYAHQAGDKYVFNDGDGSTRYDRDRLFQVGGFDSAFHEASISVQPLPFAELDDDYPLLNGRGYPDTVRPGNIHNTFNGHASQKISTLIEAEPGETILLRMSSLSTTDFYTVISPSIPMHVVGKDARQLRGPAPGNEHTGWTASSVTIGGGESMDVLLDTTGVAEGRYFIFTANLDNLANKEEDYGGIMTEVRIATPSPIQLSAPAEGATAFFDTPETFEYTIAGGAGLGDITLEISMSSSFADPTRTLSLVTGSNTDYTPSDTEWGQLRRWFRRDQAIVFTLYWRVKGTDGGMNDVYSSTRSLQISR